MTNALVPIQKQINAPRDFSYVNHKDNFPLDIRGLDNLIKIVLVEPNQLSVIQKTALTKPKTPLPVTSDYGEYAGYKEMLSARGPIRQALMYA